MQSWVIASVTVIQEICVVLMLNCVKTLTVTGFFLLKCTNQVSAVVNDFGDCWKPVCGNKFHLWSDMNESTT